MLHTVAEYKDEAIRRWRERNANAQTGVACPTEECDRELLRVIPPVLSVTELVWRKCLCPKCGTVCWLPDGGD